MPSDVPGCTLEAGMWAIGDEANESSGIGRVLPIEDAHPAPTLPDRVLICTDQHDYSHLFEERHVRSMPLTTVMNIYSGTVADWIRRNTR